MASNLSIITSISTTAENNTPEKKREAYEAHIHSRIEECLELDRQELNKKAIDLGKSAHNIIDSTIEKVKASIEEYVASHINEIVDKQQEIIHISELESRSTSKEYRDGKIIAEFQRIVVFQRG